MPPPTPPSQRQIRVNIPKLTQAQAQVQQARHLVEQLRDHRGQPSVAGRLGDGSNRQRPGGCSVFLKGTGLELLWSDLLLLCGYGALMFFFAARKLRQKVA
mgnify:CR=1 FL=1